MLRCVRCPEASLICWQLTCLRKEKSAFDSNCEAGGEYIWLAKGNQTDMEENIRLWFEPEPDPFPGMGRLPKDFEMAKEVSKGHGRLEERILTVSSQLNGFIDSMPFPRILLL